MDAAPGNNFNGRGAPRLLRDFALLERLTGVEGPSGRLRLERELGCDLADFLVGALSRSRAGEDALPVCASA